MKYSIIVTIYNAEKYIERTMNKLRNLENENIEFIIVNDGSTDKTEIFIKNYKLKNKKIINQKNMGVSAARNNGIKHSNGKYIIFLDGDDWLSKNTFNILNKHYDKDYDVIKFGFIFTNLKYENKYLIHEKDELINKKQINSFINEALKTSKYNSASNQIIKREILTKNNIQFKLNRKFAEDFDFNLNLYSKINNILLLNDCMYYYYQNAESTTKSYKLENVIKCLNDAVEIYVNSLKYYHESSISDYNLIIIRIYNEIKNCTKKLFSAEEISANKLKKILKENLFNNENYLFIKKELLHQKYYSKDIFDLILLNKILILINPILTLLNIKRKLKNERKHWYEKKYIKENQVNERANKEFFI